MHICTTGTTENIPASWYVVSIMMMIIVVQCTATFVCTLLHYYYNNTVLQKKVGGLYWYRYFNFFVGFPSSLSCMNSSINTD